MKGSEGEDAREALLSQEGKREGGGLAQQEPGRRLTRGFLRAQSKRERLREILPEDALIVAMELAQKRHCVGMSTGQKQPLDRFRTDNSPLGMEALIQQAKKVQRAHQLGKMVFAMEPTAHYWMIVATDLQHQQLPYLLGQPLSVKRERESTS